MHNIYVYTRGVDSTLQYLGRRAGIPERQGKLDKPLVKELSDRLKPCS